MVYCGKEKNEAVSRIMLTLLLMIILTLAFNIQVLEANPIPIPSIWMPEEYIDANISLVDGIVQARVNGTYPFAPLGTYYQVMMYYPVPPNADRITVEMNETKLDWTYGNETYPTVLGNWPMIIWDIAPVPEYFEIETYYEHPIPVIDGNYTFLYAMGAGKYLDHYAKETMAYVSVNISKHVADRRSLIDVYTIGYNAMTEEWTWNPADYIITEEDETWMVTLTVISETFHPLIEDLLITIRSEPTTWTVDDDGPADFSTIQEAINAASDGDTIYVYNGTYHENVVVNKTVSLIGEGRETTVIDGSGVGNVTKVTVDNVTIGGFTVINDGGWFNSGIALSNAKNCNVSRNDVTNNTVGIWLRDSSSNYISENRIMKNEAGLLLLNSSNNRLKDTIMTNNTYNFYVAGETLNHYINDVDTSNTINGKPVIYWINKQNQTIPQQAGYVAVINSTNITVKDLDLGNNWAGLVLAYTQNTVITNNNIRDNVGGISLYECSNNSISGNSLENNSIAISLDLSSNNSVCKNNIGNNWIGLHLHLASDNKLYHNNFINNTQQVSYPSHDYGNFWDDGYPSGGNYWSDYEERYPDAEELGDSGIWDTPYVIDNDNVDRYPLIEPVTGLISRTIRIIDVTTGLDSVTLGSPTKPMPSDGYTFTVSIALNGTTRYFHSFQVAVAFDNTKVKCNTAWIPKDNPSFVFYGAKFLMGGIGVYNDEGLVVLHSSLSSDYVIDGYPIRHYVNVTGDTLFGQINFTAIEPGASTLEIITTQEPIYPTWNTVLIDKDNNPIDFTAEKFSVTTIALEPFHALTFNFTVGEETYRITTLSNSTISDFNFNQTLKQISFNVTGPTGTTGFCNVTIPDDLLWGEFVVYKDSSALVKGVDYTQIHNATHYIFCITYIHTTHVIEIRGTEVIQSDTMSPTVSILSPENKTYPVGDVSLTFTVSESTSWIGYSLDGQANITIAGNTTLSGLSNGSHNLIVYAKDAAGNTGASEMVYFSITTLQPDPFPWWILGAIAGIVVIGIALGTFFLRRRKSVKS